MGLETRATESMTTSGAPPGGPLLFSLDPPGGDPSLLTFWSENEYVTNFHAKLVFLVRTTNHRPCAFYTVAQARAHMLEMVGFTWKNKGQYEAACQRINQWDGVPMGFRSASMQFRMAVVPYWLKRATDDFWNWRVPAEEMDTSDLESEEIADIDIEQWCQS